MNRPISQLPTPAATFSSKESFEAVVEHWANARIDGPMQLIARFDEAAKQLIAIGGVLQGLFFGIVGLGGWKDHLPSSLWWVVVLCFLPLVALVVCAAKVICSVPVQMEAIETYELMKRAADPDGVPDEDLLDAIKLWCFRIDRNALIKHRWLLAANWMFWVSSLATLCLLLLVVVVQPGGSG
jgi:hypothetical protein